ncbi:MAG: hypothetical protein FWB83_08290 [Treponema sp.]|nr:hypothetical protein [Treponema sp.]
MLKKGLLVLAIFALVATGAFAQMQMSYGGGVLFDMSLGNGVAYDGTEFMSTSNNSFGVYGFYDVGYAEIDIYFSYGVGTIESDTTKIVGSAGSKNQLDMSLTQIGFTLLGKYPINLGAFTLFPCIGIGYNLVLSAEQDGRSFSDAGDLSQLGILGGVGIDFPLSESMFIRGQALFQVRLPSKVMSDFISNSVFDTTLGFGPRIKIGVGFHL